MPEKIKNIWIKSQSQIIKNSKEIKYLVNGILHNEDYEKPNIEYETGTKKWYRYNKLVKLVSQNCKYLYKNGRLHSYNDIPAIEYFNGHKEWYQNGKLHRDNDKPALIIRNKHKEWWIDGKLKRCNNKHTIEYINEKQWWNHNGQHIISVFSNGTKHTYINSLFNNFILLHSIDDIPAVECQNGNKFWYNNSHWERGDDKPAFEGFDGTQIWCKQGLLHRDNGKPALITKNYHIWYINGKKIKTLIFDPFKKNEIPIFNSSYTKITATMLSFNTISSGFFNFNK
jgi:hypothetical protein